MTQVTKFLRLPIVSLLFAAAPVRSLNASDIERVNTPAPGAWPQANVTGCGITGLPPTDILDSCTEVLHPDAPDIRGYWKDPSSGYILEHIAQCGSRWIDTSKSVHHDFLSCTGVMGDSLGCMDYSGMDIIVKDGLCTPITAACKFEQDGDGNKCINLYTNTSVGTVTKAVSRCLQANGTMMWVNPFEAVLYAKVPEEDEPNCIKCFGGDHDGVVVYDSDGELPCVYEERRWLRCEDDEDATESPTSRGDSITGSLALYTTFASCVVILCSVFSMLTS